MEAETFLETGHAADFADRLLDSRSHGVIFMDADGIIRGWNRGARSITGFGAADVLGKTLASLFIPEDRARGLDELELRMAREAGNAEDERWHSRKDGSRFWSSGQTFALRKSGKVVGFVKLFRDATHLRARAKYLENLSQQYRFEQIQTDLLLGTVAHELRNPLGPMVNAIAILRMSHCSDEASRRLLGVLERQLGFLQRIVEDLVDLTRVKVGKLRLEYQLVGLQPIIEEAVDAQRESADKKRVELISVLPGVPLQVEVDGGRINQVLTNLLNNAIKFTPAGGKVWVSLTADQTHFMIEVKDTGKGIGPGLLPHVFDAFSQTDEVDVGRGSGIGIGLSLVKQIVALHQSTVEVRSEGVGNGSEFTVRIPLRRPDGQFPEPMPRRPAGCGAFDRGDR